MARSPASRARQAAETLDAFLRDRPAVPEHAVEAECSRLGDAAIGQDGIPSPGTAAPQQDGGARPPWSATAHAGNMTAGPPLRPAHTDWLNHRLTVSGPAEVLEAFRDAAAGAGTIPWRLDLDRMEEDWFHLLIRPASRTLSLAGARVLAHRLRDAVDRRHGLAVARVGRSRACPFDLHALVPVPGDILALGPDHPAALAWLWQHWGTTEALRQVAPDPARRSAASRAGPVATGADQLRLVFRSADWTPWRAVQSIRLDWPALRFDVQPDYAAG